MQIGIINGPNLNLTGSREPEIYGSQTFNELLSGLEKEFPGTGFFFFQTSIEGEIIEKLYEFGSEMDGIILNAGGYTHTSVAIADAVKVCAAPVIEVHLSNIFRREDYRHISFLGAHTEGIIAGFGMDSYYLAVRQLLRITG
jgi:3-dehydroquinate dehydratase-2